MAQKLFTAKLDEEDIEAMRRLAGGRPMAELLRGWIRVGQAVYTPPDDTGTLGLDTAVDRPVDRVDTSTAADLTFVVDTHGSRDKADWTPRQVRRPSFLAAPDDDCAACGHDRQSYHLTADGTCAFPTAPRSRCGCPAFVDTADPF